MVSSDLSSSHPAADWLQSVWLLVKLIPQGKVATYGQIAALLGHPRHARHVGRALRLTPKHVDVPWHRVVGSQGRSVFDLGTENALIQRARLESEGVIFNDRDRINLKIYRWQP